MSPAAVERIYQAAIRTNRNEFRLEDFYYTGILRKKANLPEPSSMIYKNGTRLTSLCHHYGTTLTADSIKNGVEQLLRGSFHIPVGA